MRGPRVIHHFCLASVKKITGGGWNDKLFGICAERPIAVAVATLCLANIHAELLVIRMPQLYQKCAVNIFGEFFSLCLVHSVFAVARLEKYLPALISKEVWVVV